LDAAVDLIGELGWSAVTSRGIAERAGVNNGVVHYHFGSMDALRKGAVEHALAALLDDSVGAFTAATTARDAVGALAEALPSPAMADAATTVVLEAMLHAPRDTHVREQMSQMLVTYRDAIDQKLRDDVAAGRLPSATDTTQLAVALLACLDGLVLHAMVDHRLDVRAAAATVAALLDARQGALR
jgi:AcrR family transcriptional regulator